jgi:hypothetical protein
MKKATKKQINELTLEMSTKYEDLVWYARSGRNLNIPEVVKHRGRVEELYSDETKQLSSEGSDFYHGFNSGMLAGMRYILSMMEIGVEEAQQNFPELDT